MRKFFTVLIALVFVGTMANAQQHSDIVSQDIMNKIYQEVKTPYKYGLVMVPADALRKMDCPTVFRKGRYW
ncbi:MAG TPA: hypothetical protein VL088_12365, partial [Pedobacter sp.]|nr:hypothetical protein [Pedobacter sp.]